MRIDYIYNVCYRDMGEYHIDSSFINLEKAIDRLLELNIAFELDVYNEHDGRFNFSIDYIKNKDKQYYLDEFNRRTQNK